MNNKVRTNVGKYILRTVIVISILIMLVSSVNAKEYAYVASMDSDTIKVVDTATNTIINSVNVGDQPSVVAVNPGRTRLYVTNYLSDNVSVIDIATNKVITSVNVAHRPLGIAVNPTGTRVYVVNRLDGFRPGNISVIDTATNSIVTSVNVGPYPVGVAVNPAGTRAYVTNPISNNVSVIDTMTNTVVASVNVGESPYGVAVSPDGTRVYVTCERVYIIDTATNTVATSVNVGIAHTYGVAVNSAGTRVYVTNPDSDNVSVIDTMTNTVIASVKVGDSPHDIAVNTDGTRVYVSNFFSSNVSVIDTTTNTVMSSVNIGVPGGVAIAKFDDIPTETVTVNITTPANNSYSEELVNFSGTANGGTPPYTYTWTSDIDGLLGTTTTASLSNEFNKKLTIGTRNISLTIKDSVGNTDIKTATLTVVKQEVELLIVPTNYTNISEGKVYGVTALNIGELSDIADKVKKFYLKSSYGSVGLNFSIYPDIIISAGYSSHDEIIRDAIKQIAIARPEYLTSNKYQIIAIVDEISFPEGQAFPTSWYNTNFSIVAVPSIAHNSRVLGDYRAGVWEHEIGHILDSNTLIDLFGHGDVYFWDLMGLGSYVFDKENNNLINKPADLSSVNKIKLGFLKRNEVGYGSYLVNSLENMNRDDSALIYKTPSIPGLHELEYVIEAREVAPSTVCTNDKGCFSIENGILIYKSEKMVLQWKSGAYFPSPYLGDFISILRKKPVAKDIDATWFAPSFFSKDGPSAEPYEDCARFVKFSVTESYPDHPYSSRVQISEPGLNCKILKGVIMATTPILWGIIPLLYPTGINSTSSDLDLHAYTPDGKHVGMNYTSDEYETRIPGAVASGDLIGGEEWIFVPTGTQVRYSVDSHNVKKFLEENPDMDPANATMNYSTTSMEYGENPQLEQLPDGNWTVTNRTISVPKEDTIEPGTTKTIRIITGDVNNDAVITVADALLYLRYSVGQDISPYHIDMGDDVTCDGKITVADALMVLRKAVGQNVTLQC
jgi:YVTN family beta-propeller protein